ncbi:MAG TPA: hypothetical protein VMS43_03170 [Allosphingosinicella sp.]|nr:hypothetical protein [Allosphingosinicella sp.]
MGWNDHVDFELYEMVSDAVDEGHLDEESAAYGIAQKFIHEGYDSLSDKQKWVYDNRVLPALKGLQEDRDAERRRELLERDDYVGFTTGL